MIRKAIGKLQYLKSLALSKKINKQIIVIESDDWGSERIPSLEVRNALEKLGIDMYTNPHLTYDTLETVEDLEVLEELLDYFYEKFDKKVKITPNFITSNPDFNKIKEGKFQNYYFETFDKTYFKRDNNNNVINHINKLIAKDFFQPQFHGREHINANYWLEELKEGNQDFLNAFDLNCYAIDSKKIKKNRKNLMGALEYDNEQQKAFIEDSIKIGHQIFEDVFGFKSTTFIAPRYVWNDDINSVFVNQGFTHLQTVQVQKSFENSEYKNIYHYTGQKNKKHNIKYLVRNVYFEPAYGKIDWVKSALDKIDLAFKFKIPAIISMHRINFVGGIDKNNRDESLKQFKLLIETIIKKYPEVEFLTSDELAKQV